MAAERKILPFFDRKALTNLNRLDSIYWDLIVKSSFQGKPLPVEIPLNKLRSKFVLKKSEIQKLKDLVLAKSTITYISSYSVACALIWVCSAKSAAASGENVADDEPDYFNVVAGCRERLNPPLPENYVGSCITQFKAELNHGELKRPDGFVKAVIAIAEAIKENLYGEKGIMKAVKKWPEELNTMGGKRQHWVAGSPKYDFYTVDYGWGKPENFEILFIDMGLSGVNYLSISKSRYFQGGLEIGVSKPAAEMNAFVSIFHEDLRDLLNKSELTRVPRL